MVLYGFIWVLHGFIGVATGRFHKGPNPSYLARLLDLLSADDRPRPMRSEVTGAVSETCEETHNPRSEWRFIAG